MSCVSVERRDKKHADDDKLNAWNVNNYVRSSSLDSMI